MVKRCNGKNALLTRVVRAGVRWGVHSDAGQGGGGREDKHVERPEVGSKRKGAAKGGTARTGREGAREKVGGGKEKSTGSTSTNDMACGGQREAWESTDG